MATALFRPRPACAEGRNEIRSRMRELVGEAEALEREHQARAARMGEIRRELTMLRDAMVNVAPGKRTRYRKPRVPGPAPVGRPAPPAVPVRGRHLRYAALGVLLRARKPMTLPEIHRALHAAGFVIDGWHPVKQLADALGWEHEKQRARRVRRGVYEIGRLNPYRRRRALREAERLASERALGRHPRSSTRPQWDDEWDEDGASEADAWRAVGVSYDDGDGDGRPP